MSIELEWVSGNDTGASSMCLWRQMMGVGNDAKLRFREKAYPHDPDDLGRCVRLLDLIPAWRERLPEMASCGPVWAALVEHWQELETLYREELPSGMARRCYKRMQEIIRPLEDTRIAHIDGPNGSISFTVQGRK